VVNTSMLQALLALTPLARSSETKPHHPSTISGPTGILAQSLRKLDGNRNPPYTEAISPDWAAYDLIYLPISQAPLFCGISGKSGEMPFKDLIIL
jgi:hypothetical protein